MTDVILTPWQMDALTRAIDVIPATETAPAYICLRHGPSVWVAQDLITALVRRVSPTEDARDRCANWRVLCTDASVLLEMRDPPAAMLAEWNRRRLELAKADGL